MGNQLLLSHEYIRQFAAEGENGQTQAALASIVCSSPNAVISFSRDDRVTSWSPGAEALYGFGADEIIGRAPTGLFREDPVLREGSRREPLLQACTAVHRYEARHFTRAGSAVDVAVALSPLRAREGALSGAVAVISDLSERKRAELELSRARAAAEQAARLKSAILSNLSHEIRTPLNVILGYAELIDEYFACKGDASQRDALAAIMRAGDRLCNALQDVLDLSKVEAGAFELNPVCIELARILERQVAGFARIALSKGLEFECAIERPGAAVMFDEYCLERALAILLDNAIKFTSRGKVSVRLGTDSMGILCIQIRDTGTGIAAHHLSRLFEPFSQQQAGPDRGFQGMGLGLALCRRYLELNGAPIAVESAEGRGTTFTIRFPRHEERFGVARLSDAVAGLSARQLLPVLSP
jgi:PAS domain S-box-containing protein